MMEEQSSHPIAGKNDRAIGIIRSLRDVPPTHYILKMKPFSSFLNSKKENYESSVFEAGGYKWKLSIYPNGKKKKNVTGHISLYLAIAEMKTLPPGWEVNVNFKFFVYDHIQDKYLTIQDTDGGTRRFRAMKTEWGFDQLLPLHDFNDASNGYLLDDCCVFGAEVFVMKPNGIGECASMMEYTYTWNINNFSELYRSLSSEEFVVEEHKWKLNLYPKGYGSAEGKSLSLFLQLVDRLPPGQKVYAEQLPPGQKVYAEQLLPPRQKVYAEQLPPGQKVYAEYKLRIRDQLHGKHFEKEVLGHWFFASTDSRGYGDFLSLSDLNDVSKGFKVKDAVIVEAQFMFMSSPESF